MTNEILSIGHSVTNFCCCGGRETLTNIPEESVSSCIRAWMVAGGSILVVVVAVLQDWIRSWFKARLDFTVSTQPPHLIPPDLNPSRPGSSNPIAEIWVEVKNVSRCLVAKHVRASVVDIYVRDAAGTGQVYKRKFAMHPCTLVWSGMPTQRNSSVWISPMVSEYTKLMVVRQPEKGGVKNSNDEDPPQSDAAPTLVVQNENVEYLLNYDFQDVIVKVRFTGSNVRSRLAYFQVEWRGSCFKQLCDESSKYLSCVPLSEKSAKSKIVEDYP